jgi:hypothetical protein
MRWTKWQMTSSRVARVVVALSLVIAALPEIELVTFGLKWT